jgi:hypothetical protein
LKPVEQIKYKLVDVQPDNAVIVNPRAPSARIVSGNSQKSPGHHNEKTN